MPAPEPRRPRLPAVRPWPWIALFLVALAARLACVLIAEPEDAATRVAGMIAHNLAEGRGFSASEDATPRAVPTAAMAPLAPSLLAMAMRPAPRLWPIPFIVRCLLGALAPLLLLHLGGTLFGGRSMHLAAWACALDPLLLVRGTGRLQETLFGVALLLGLALTAAWIKRPRSGRAFGVGVAWGLCWLSAAAALPILLLTLVWVWTPLGVTVGEAERRRQFGRLLLGVGLTLLPWLARNAVVMRDVVPLSTSAGLALLSGNHPEAWNDPRWTGRGADVVTTEPYASRLAGLSEPARDRRAAGLAIGFVAQHPGGWLRAAIVKLEALWDPRGGPAPTRVPGWIFVVWSWAVYAFALGGVVRTAMGPRRWFQSPPWLVIASACATAVVFHGAAAGRMAVEPMIVLLAALGFLEVRRQFRFHRRGLRVVEGRAA